jgi:hypothetical protein
LIGAGETFSEERAKAFIEGYFRLQAIMENGNYFPLVVEVLFMHIFVKGLVDGSSSVFVLYN